MKLHVVDYKEVQTDFDTGVPTAFNTNFHTAEEAPSLPIPSNKPYSFDRWLPLILQSRKIPASDLQIVSLSRSQVDVVVHAASASIHTRLLSRAYAEDLEENVCPAFEGLEFPSEGLFMRLGACSTKDGVQKTPRKLSVHSVDELILQLTTSMRAWSALTNLMNTAADEMKIFFLPFDKRMNTEREYRVFCIPESLRVTAVSQYKWHKPWVFAQRERAEQDRLARVILDGIDKVHSEIFRALRSFGDDEMAMLFKTQGFSFDVLYLEETGLCELIELNTFGVRSACGSCLFHWLNDREVLYGLVSEDVEFRVAF